MISWPDGLELGPDDLPYRQLPEETVWSSTVWVSNNGVVRRRYFNAVSSTWTWGEPFPLTLSGDGRVGIFVDHWMSLERVIALAWRCCAPESQSSVSILPNKPCRAKHVRWAAEEDGEEVVDATREKWKALDWYCGIARCDRQYLISTKGRLKSPFTGAITRGHIYEGQRWAAVKHAGLVPLDTAARLRRDVVYIPPYLAQARQALLTGHTPAELAELGVATSTAWNYFCRAAEMVNTAELLRLVPRLVSKELWKALQQVQDDRLGGPLKALMEAVKERLPRDPGDDDETWSQLRIARLALVAKTVRPP